MSRIYDRRPDVRAAAKSKPLKAIHEKVLLAVKLLQGGGGCTPPEILDCLKAGGEERTAGSLAQLLTHLVNRGDLRRTMVGRYALALPAKAAAAAPASGIEPSSIPPPTDAQKMAGSATRARRSFPLEHPLWPEDRSA